MAFTLPGFQTGNLKKLLKVSTGLMQTYVNYAVNSAVIRVGVRFRAEFTENLNGVDVVHTFRSGSPTGTQVDLYAVDANGFPTGSSLATATYTAASSAISTVTFSAAYGVTAGTVYALVWQNATATPASNYFTFAGHVQSGIGMLDFFYSGDSGTTWITAITGQEIGFVALALNYATSGSRAPLLNTFLGVGYDQGLYNDTGTRRAIQGVRWNSDHKVLLWGMEAIFNTKIGSPSFNVKGVVCDSSSILSSSTSMVATPSTAMHRVWWDTPYELAASTDYNIGFTPDGADDGDSSNYVALSMYTKLLLPATFGPLTNSVYSTGASPSFSQSTKVPALNLYVEIKDAGSGVILPAHMNGGFDN